MSFLALKEEIDQKFKELGLAMESATGEELQVSNSNGAVTSESGELIFMSASVKANSNCTRTEFENEDRCSTVPEYRDVNLATASTSGKKFTMSFITVGFFMLFAIISILGLIITTWASRWLMTFGATDLCDSLSSTYTIPEF
ncbi:uncharacterized protein MELLADRAFT_102931 [Melampsora larici-populina 98AG31]|uniref:Uncharacterized protein n=1 Tax=Melampsora larici-populina (strain 98AG31 / pathotype 3-4-7) TaxID=747676 RepID=F4R8M5_MELLP|nr:uncharacterized protein MELLADRAFT_102931 [Melampsora larici-populina 98AG31]EGG11087.1 hypothetical protein MELLADRAFT_102931 [Melampsora larici-populina 98AG31]